MRLFALCSLLLILCAPALSAAPDAAQATAVLVVGEFEGHHAFGSGVIIGIHAGLRIATAGHVGVLTNAKVITQAGEELSVTSVHFIPGYDLALLQTAPTRMMYAAARRAERVTRNQAVDVWGYGAWSVPRRLA
ncbi:MAG: serine protease, partial [Candidatus Eremiobacteraeota bacterium]|nr:serine protease [Candidatus Eremiobacteraeota bacterium]